MMLYGFSPALLGEGTREITAALEARDLSPLPTVHFPLDDIAAAHDAVQSRTLGKVLVELP